MTTSKPLSLARARALATSLLHHTHAGRGWSGPVDRDLVREYDELVAISQSQLRQR